MNALHWVEVPEGYLGYLNEDDGTCLFIIDSTGPVHSLKGAFISDSDEINGCRFTYAAHAKRAAEDAMSTWISVHTHGWKSEPREQEEKLLRTVAEMRHALREYLTEEQLDAAYGNAGREGLRS